MIALAPCLGSLRDFGGTVGPKTSVRSSSVDGTLNSAVEPRRERQKERGTSWTTQRNATQSLHVIAVDRASAFHLVLSRQMTEKTSLFVYLALMCSLFLERLHAVSVTRTVQPAGNNEVTYISSPLLAQESLAHDSRFLRAFSCYFFINLVAPVSPFLRQPNLIFSR